MPSKIKYDEVKRFFDYNAETGVLTWRARSSDLFESGNYSAERKCASWNARYAGRSACSDNGSGYLTTRLMGRNMKAHRVCMAFLLKDDFSGYVDHINGDRSDNRALNLRPTNHAENARNCWYHRSNQAGVVWYKPSRKWRSQIWAEGKNKCLGYFSCVDDAIKARVAAEATYWGDR